jgi:hypothetical protein
MSVALVFAAMLSLIAWLVPVHMHPWTTFHSDFAMSCAAFIVAATAVCRRRGATDRWPVLAIVAALAAVVPAVQYLFGQIMFLDDAWMSALYLFGFALAQVVGFMVVAQHGLRRPFEIFSWLVLIAGLLSVWICLYQWLRLDYLGAMALELAPGTRPAANLAQPNQLATLLLWSQVATGFLHTRKHIRAPVAMALLFMFSLGLAMTQSRAGLLGFALVIIWLVATRCKAEEQLPAAAVATATLTMACCVVIWHLLLPLSPDATGRAERVTDAGVRLLHWESMIDAILRRPWAGYGWGQLPTAHYEVALDHPVSRETLGFAHNQALDVLVWSGIPFGTLIICAVAWWFVVALRRAHSSEQIFATAVVLGVFVHAMVEFPLAHAYFSLPTGFLMGGISCELARRAFVAPGNYRCRPYVCGAGYGFGSARLRLCGARLDGLAYRTSTYRLAICRACAPAAGAQILWRVFRVCANASETWHERARNQNDAKDCFALSARRQSVALRRRSSTK